MVADLDGPRDPLLYRAAVCVCEPRGDVADPRGGDAPDAACADELIERDVRDRSDELEFAPLLADELVREGEGNRRLERAPERDRCAVGYESRYRLGEADALVRG